MMLLLALTGSVYYFTVFILTGHKHIRFNFAISGAVALSKHQVEYLIPAV